MVEVPWHRKAASMVGRITHSDANETTCESNKAHGGFRATFRQGYRGNTAEVHSFLENRDMDQPGSREFLTRVEIGLHGRAKFLGADHIKVSDLAKIVAVVQKAHDALQKHAPK